MFNCLKFTIEVAIYFPVTANNSKFFVRKYTYAVTFANSEWSWFLHNCKLLLKGIQT